MKCKKCGKEFEGEIQRYCNVCKGTAVSTHVIEEKEEEITNTKKAKKKAKAKQETVTTKEQKTKRSPIFTIGYVLLVLLIMIIVFGVSIVIGFSIGPALPI